MPIKWVILIVIVALAAVTVLLYWFAFYKKKTPFKKKDKIDQEIIKIDKSKPSWILFSNTFLEHKKGKWISFDNMILSDFCMYMINDITDIGTISNYAIDEEMWIGINKKGEEITFKNPIEIYKKNTKYLQDLTKFNKRSMIIIVVSNESAVAEGEDWMSIRIQDFERLQSIIDVHEAKSSYTERISMDEKKRFMMNLSNKTFEINKKNILDKVDEKVIFGGKKNGK